MRVLVNRMLLPWSMIHSFIRNPLAKNSWAIVFFLPLLFSTVTAIRYSVENIETSYKLLRYVINIARIIDIPFKYELIYCSALFFTLANIISVVLCPKIISQFSNSSEFLSQGFGIEYLIGYFQSMPGDKISNKKRMEDMKIINNPSSDVNCNDYHGIKNILKDKDVISVFWNIFNNENQSKWNVRLFLSILIYTGILCWLEVFRQSIFSAFRSMFF